MAGWLKISREINNHWIWKDPTKLKWWIDILLTVNYEDKKTSIGFKIFECKRGESLLSLVNWAKRWGVSKSVVNNYFNMLEKDNMITIKNETVTTRITVCNYDSYQQSENAFETQGKRKENARQPQHNTTKEREEDKEREEEDKEQSEIPIPKFDFKKSLLFLGVDEKIIKDWLTVRKLKKCANTETAFNKLKKQIELSGLTANECIKISVEKSWGGFESEWLNKQNLSNNGKNNNRTSLPSEDEFIASIQQGYINAAK